MIASTTVVMIPTMIVMSITVFMFIPTISMIASTTVVMIPTMIVMSITVFMFSESSGLENKCLIYLKKRVFMQHKS